MTVSYNFRVTDTGIMTFIWLFFRWKGSVWKAVYKELLLWLVLYYMLNLPYRFLMNASWQRAFERLCVFFYNHSEFIPLTFMLGFFVNLVVDRWWRMWQNIGWIDTPGLYIATYLTGDDERSRMFRRNIVRYLLFFQVLVFRDISTPIRERFPTLETLVPAGYLTQSELRNYINIETNYKNYYTPIRWAMNLIKQARTEGKIASDHAVQDLLTRIMNYRCELGTLLSHDFQPIPLLYTEVVCLTVRLFFIIALLGRQALLANAPREESMDLYVPIMTIIQFIFYMGWMKVAEALLNPFGGDDDDFECNWLIDRNFEVGYIIADQTNDVSLERDRNWGNKNPEPLYSKRTMNVPINPLLGSAERRSSAQLRASDKASYAGSVVGAREFRKGSAAPEPVDVIMVPRPSINTNEEALLSRFGGGDTTVHVRSSARRPSAPPSVVVFSESESAGNLLKDVKRRLSSVGGSFRRKKGRVGPDDQNNFGAPSGSTSQPGLWRSEQVESGLNKHDDFTFIRRSVRGRRPHESPHPASTIMEEGEEQAVGVGANNNNISRVEIMDMEMSGGVEPTGPAPAHYHARGGEDGEEGMVEIKLQSRSASHGGSSPAEIERF